MDAGWTSSDGAELRGRRADDEEDEEFESLDDFEEDEEFEDDDLDEDEDEDEGLDEEDEDAGYDDLDDDYDDDGVPRRGGGGRPKREWE